MKNFYLLLILTFSVKLKSINKKENIIIDKQDSSPKRFAISFVRKRIALENFVKNTSIVLICRGYVNNTNSRDHTFIKIQAHIFKAIPQQLKTG